MSKGAAGRSAWGTWGLGCLLLLALPATGGAQQNGAPNGNGGEPPAAGAAASAAADSAAAAEEREAVLARADSARAALVQPPGSYGGIRPMDVVRVPFQLFGATLALGLAGVGAAYAITDELILDPAMAARDALAEIGVEAGVDSFGNRSWPGVVLRYEGLMPFYAEAGYSLRQYEHYEAGLELSRSDFGAHAFGRFQRQRQPHFWGVGADAPEANRSDYSADITMGTASTWWNPARGPLTFTAEAGWERTDVLGRGWDGRRPNANEVFEPSLVFGLDDRLDYVRTGVDATLDRTHVEHLQVRGFSATAGWRWYEGMSGTSSSFHRVAADARAFVPVNERQLIALRVLAEDRVGESGRGVPFTHMAELGDEEGLRGYSGRRFRDRALLAAQLEWRYEVFWHPGFPDLRVEGFAFADAGTVAPSLGSVDFSDFRTTPGLGLRYVQEGDAKLEVFTAHGGEGWRFGLGLGRSF